MRIERTNPVAGYRLWLAKLPSRLMLAATKTRRSIRFPELVRAWVSSIMSGLVLIWSGWPQRLQVALAVIPKKLPCIPHHGRKMLTRQSAPAVRLNRLTPRDVRVVRAVKSLRLGSQKRVLHGTGLLDYWHRPDRVAEGTSRYCPFALQVSFYLTWKVSFLGLVARD